MYVYMYSNLNQILFTLKAKHSTCIRLKVRGYTTIFRPFISRGTILAISVLEDTAFSKMGSTLKGKNLLLQEQILSF